MLRPTDKTWFVMGYTGELAAGTSINPLHAGMLRLTDRTWLVMG